jgi:hypothetical protein
LFQSIRINLTPHGFALNNGSIYQTVSYWLEGPFIQAYNQLNPNPKVTTAMEADAIDHDPSEGEYQNDQGDLGVDDAWHESIRS